MKKKILSLALSFALVITCAALLTACGSKDFDASKIKVGETTFTYDGNSHVYEVTYEELEIAISYSESKDGEFKPASELNYVNAGTYNLYYKVSAEGYNDYISSETTALTIAKRNLTIAVGNTTELVGQQERVKPSLTVTTGEVVEGDNLANEVSFAYNIAGKTAGQTGTVVASSNSQNYNITFTNNPAEVKIIDAIEVISTGGSTFYSSFEEAIAQNQDMSIKLHKDLVLTSNILINNQKHYTLNLNGHTISMPTAASGSITIFKVDGVGSKLTINGEGVVNSTTTTNDYAMAVWARNGGEVVINSGTFINTGSKNFEDDGTTANNHELIYASSTVADGSKITINGGTFIGNYENTTFGTRYTLNHLDNDNSEFFVKGGQFRQYDPADSKSENPAGNFVATGYTSTATVIDGVEWFVVTETQA